MRCRLRHRQPGHSSGPQSELCTLNLSGGVWVLHPQPLMGHLNKGRRTKAACEAPPCAMPAAALAAWPFLWPSECASHKEWIQNLSLETDLHHQSLMRDLSRASGAGRTKAFEAPPCVIQAAGTGSLAIPPWLLGCSPYMTVGWRQISGTKLHRVPVPGSPGSCMQRCSCIVVAWPSSGPSEPAVYTECGQDVTRVGRLPALHDTGSACSTTIILDLVDLLTHQNCVPISGQSRPQTRTLDSLVGSQKPRLPFCSCPGRRSAVPVPGRAPCSAHPAPALSPSSSSPEHADQPLPAVQVHVKQCRQQWWGQRDSWGFKAAHLADRPCFSPALSG